MTAGGRQRTALAKATAVVEALTDHQRIAEIAAVTGLAQSTIHRILRELVDLGWVTDDGSHGYLLGPRLLAVAGQASDRDTIARLAHPILTTLSERTGYTVHFAVLSGDEAIYVDKLEGRRSYHMRSRIGVAIPLYCTAIGKATLAAMDAASVRALVARTGLPRRTERTITTVRALAAHLDDVRAAGYAVDDEENELHTRCIGAAVFGDHGRPIGGVSLSALTFDLAPEQVPELAPVVQTTAAEVSHALGASARAD